MPMHAITLVPSDMTIARQVLASHHAARVTVKLFSLSSQSSEESHWRSPDSSTEVSYLSVLKNNVSVTRGLNFYCRRFPQGSSSGFLIEHFLRNTELIYLNPSNSAVISYDSRSIKSLSEDYASTSSSARTSSEIGRAHV